MSLGNQLVLLRKRRGMIQGRLAELLNIHQSMDTRWEKDRVSPKGETLVKLAQIFEIKVEDLLPASSEGILRRSSPSFEDPKLMDVITQPVASPQR